VKAKVFAQNMLQFGARGLGTALFDVGQVDPGLSGFLGKTMVQLGNIPGFHALGAGLTE
jgi:hypothetical protein